MNIFTAITHIENLLLESGPFAFLAHQFDVRKKLHFDGHCAIALTDFTPPTRQVEGEVRRIKAPRLSLARAGKHFANRVVHFDISDGIGTRRSTNRRLIDKDNVINRISAFEFLEGSNVSLPLPSLLLQAGIDAIVYECRLAGAAYAGDANSHIKRYFNIDGFQIVFCCAIDAQSPFLKRSSLLRLFDLSVTSKVSSG